MKITLSKPISVHGEEVTELELREPTGEDVMALGYPYLIIIGDGDDQAMELRPKVIARYVSRLAGIPPSSLNKVSPADFSGMTGAVMGFFGVEPEALKS
ncbi:MAG: phage tail assembly protein [Gallionella sp.]|nr:phage tail assembly protein [Gallionella sp.]